MYIVKIHRDTVTLHKLCNTSKVQTDFNFQLPETTNKLHEILSKNGKLVAM